MRCNPQLTCSISARSIVAIFRVRDYAVKTSQQAGKTASSTK
jgi:hypothetical protein